MTLWTARHRVPAANGGHVACHIPASRQSTLPDRDGAGQCRPEPCQLYQSVSDFRSSAKAPSKLRHSWPTWLETFGGWKSAPGGTLSWGGCWSRLGCYVNDQSTVCSQYNTPACAGMDASAGYYGRGALQLSYCANYEKAGQFLGKDLLGNPNLLVHDGVTAFEASLWYWTHFDEASCCGVTGQTCHAAITQDRDFSKKVAIINGGIECNTRNADTLARTEFLRRHQALARICRILGIAVPPCTTTCNSWPGTAALRLALHTEQTGLCGPISPQRVTTTGWLVLPLKGPTFSMARSIRASGHLPEHDMLAVQPWRSAKQMKNCDPLVFGPELAMLRQPKPVCFPALPAKDSSSNLAP